MTDQQAKVEAAEAARKASAEAEARRTETAASVFISRKTQRLYVRQAFEPVPADLRVAHKKIRAVRGKPTARSRDCRPATPS
jgi:hypothetical protein